MLTRRFQLKEILFIGMLGLLFRAAPGAAQENDAKNYAEECKKGLTIYCLAAGMEERKAGNRETALAHFHDACKSHKTAGHLRACTPYLSLAQELDRLDEASAPLEARCRAGEDIVCFYLAKEYLRITAHSRAHAHLERLCREDFKSPDPEDYGPCYHLGDSLEQQKSFDAALNFFQLECERGRDLSLRSCERFQTLTHWIEHGGESAFGVRARPFTPIEAVALGAVALSFAGWGLLWTGAAWAFRTLAGPLPAAAGVCWVVWLLREGDRPHADFPYVIPSVLLLLGFWIAARGRLRALREQGKIRIPATESSGRKGSGP